MLGLICNSDKHNLNSWIERILSLDNVPKKQHYVPQYYLRRFTDTGEGLWVYDRARKKKYKSCVGDVCERNHHYEMKAAQPRDWHGPFLLHGKTELKLSQIEAEQSDLLARVDEQALSGRINEKERRGIAWLVGHLVARHPDMLDDNPPDQDALMSDPGVRAGYEILNEMGMGDEFDVLAQGADQMVLALWRRKGTPTYFIKNDLERLRYHFISPKGEARFITSSFPTLCNTTLREDGKEHIDDLMLPLSNTLAVVYDEEGPSSNMVVKVSDEYVIRRNAGHFVSVPVREQILAGRERDLDNAMRYAQRSMIGGFRRTRI